MDPAAKQPRESAAARAPRPELRWLPTDKLDVDRAYQRSLETRRGQEVIAGIVARFTWAAFGTVLATPGAKGRFLVIDGQHRTEAARRLGLAEVPALVVATRSQAEQAAAFVQANLDRVTVNRFALHHAQLIAGDERAKAIDAVCRACGVTIPKYPIPADKLQRGQTLALATVSVLITKLGPRGAEDVLRAVATAWEGAPGTITAALLRAAAKIYAGGASAVDRARSMEQLALWLKRTKPSELFGRALRRKESYGGTEADSLAAVIGAGIGGTARQAATARPLNGSGIKPPSREQLMGRRA